MKELTRSVRAHLLAGYVTALLLLGVTAIGAVTATGTVSREFVQAVQTDTPLMQDVRLSIKLMDDEETGLRGYLLTHDTSFLTPYTTARRVRPCSTYRRRSLQRTWSKCAPFISSPPSC